VTCGWLLCSVLVAAAIVSTIAEDIGGACTKGDTPCFCKAIGGTWKALQSPLLPACKVTYQHQGMCMFVLSHKRRPAASLVAAALLRSTVCHFTAVGWGSLQARWPKALCRGLQQGIHMRRVVCFISSRCTGLYRQVYDCICCRPVIQPICASTLFANSEQQQKADTRGLSADQHCPSHSGLFM